MCKICHNSKNHIHNYEYIRNYFLLQKNFSKIKNNFFQIQICRDTRQINNISEYHIETICIGYFEKFFINFPFIYIKFNITKFIKDSTKFQDYFIIKMNDSILNTNYYNNFVDFIYKNSNFILQEQNYEINAVNYKKNTYICEILSA